MKPIRFVSWILVVGILLIFSLSSVGSDNQGGKEAPLVSETLKGKTVIPPLADDPQKKLTTPVSVPVYKPISCKKSMYKNVIRD